MPLPPTITNREDSGNAGDIVIYNLVDFFAPQPTISTLRQLHPPGMHQLIQTNAYGTHLFHRSVEVCFEIPVRYETPLNVARPPILRMQLGGFEVADVLRVEEHVSHGGRLAVQYEWMGVPIVGGEFTIDKTATPRSRILLQQMQGCLSKTTGPKAVAMFVTPWRR